MGGRLHYKIRVAVLLWMSAVILILAAVYREPCVITDAVLCN